MPKPVVAGRPTHYVADIAATVLLTALQLMCAYYSLVLVLIGGSMGTSACSISDDDPCDWTAIEAALFTTLPVIAITVLGSLIVSVRRVRRGRYAFAVPLIGMAILIAVMVVFIRVIDGAT